MYGSNHLYDILLYTEFPCVVCVKRTILTLRLQTHNATLCSLGQGDRLRRGIAKAMRSKQQRRRPLFPLFANAA